jgi:hypothetical protein
MTGTVELLMISLALAIWVGVFLFLTGRLRHP